MKNTKPISKRTKINYKFSYDLNNLGFTIGRNSQCPVSSTRPSLKKILAVECCNRKECYDCHGGVFKKASLTDLSYRDLFVKTKFLKKVDDTCAICLRSFMKQKFVWKLSCNHYFHYECIEKWSDMEHYTCPLCRQEYYYP